MHFNEPKLLKFNRFAFTDGDRRGFSALQRAEIAEIAAGRLDDARFASFSALQRAEIAEIDGDERGRVTLPPFQCSSTSRNC